MAYHNKVYVSMDADNDLHYYRLMQAWKQNDNIGFNFYDAHDINNIKTFGSDPIKGTDRMLETLNRNREAGAKELLEQMKEEIDAFAGEIPQFDDTTMLSFIIEEANQRTVP